MTVLNLHGIGTVDMASDWLIANLGTASMCVVNSGTVIILHLIIILENSTKKACTLIG